MSNVHWTILSPNLSLKDVFLFKSFLVITVWKLFIKFLDSLDFKACRYGLGFSFTSPSHLNFFVALGIMLDRLICEYYVRILELKLKDNSFWYGTNGTKEHGILGRLNRSCHPYHMIIHVLQTVLNLNKKYLSNVQIPLTCIQNRLLNTLNSEKIRLHKANKIHFLRCKILPIQAYFKLKIRAGNFWMVDIGIKAWSTLFLNLEIKKCLFSSCY